MKLNHIAVVLRGHVRTWLHIKDFAFSFYESIADNVDYYFSTWGHTQLSTYDINESFTGRNLVICLINKINTDYYDSWLAPAWLSYAIRPYKRLREKNVKYDAVIDTRPDILPRFHPAPNRAPPLFRPEPNTLYTTGFEIFGYHDKRSIGISDHFLLCSSEVFDVMAERFITRLTNNGQVEYRLFAEREGYNVCELDWALAHIIRPNAVATILSNPQLYFDNSHRYTFDWMGSLTTEEKIEILKITNISTIDYSTQSLLAKL